MPRLLALALAVSIGLPVVSGAAAQPERIRGTIASLGGDQVAVQTREGGTVEVTLTNDTRYASIVKSSLTAVAQGSYIGTAAKDTADGLVALEVVVFPPAMRGAGEGHYPWDKLSDTSGLAATSMTNGSVTSSAAAAQVESSMTNGNVDSADTHDGAKQLIVSYKGGQQTILVPPNVPVVTFQPADRSAVIQGAPVFVRAQRDGDKVTAQFVGVGTGGVVPPM